MTEQELLIVKPADLALADFRQVLTQVKGGEAVEHAGLQQRIQSCYLIAVLKVNGAVASTAAIKNADEMYVRGIGCKSDYTIPRGMRELGYVATDTRFRRRGLAERVCRHLVAEYNEPLFATTSSDAMRRILSVLGFQVAGSPWQSQRDPLHMLHLWVDLRTNRKAERSDV